MKPIRIVIDRARPPDLFHVKLVGHPLGFRIMRLAAILVSVAVTIASGAGAAEPVDIPDAGATLRGVLFRPQGAGPFPSVVALHGCGGLLNRSGKIVRRFADWGDRLSAAGVDLSRPTG
jgi:poly(3-hydroxybutyrate) depolymerase